MRRAGMVAALQDVRAGRRGEPAACREAACDLLDELAGRINFGLDAFDRIVTISCG